MSVFGILVAGGPAPGINAAIAAATIEARNRGSAVIGFYDGFKWLATGDATHAVNLDVREVSAAHFDGGSILRTSRTRATRAPGAFERIADTLARRGVDRLITIGGEGTACVAARLAAIGPALRVAHIPKTIDNDLPLPGDVASVGFSTACNLGKDLVMNLMQDAATTQRWFFVTVMGRQTGHLALGIGGAAAATLTVIPEEFEGRRLSLSALADLLEGAILKRWVMGRPHGVAILSEGLVEVLEAESLGPLELDPAGHPRFGEVELGRALKDHVSRSLGARGLDVTIVAKDLGYELRCAPPGARDLQYGRALGYWATRFLLDGGSGAMITIEGGRLVPVPFPDLLDPATGVTRVRRVDIHSEAYATLAAYMIRLQPHDLEDPTMCAALAREGRMPVADVVSRLGRALRRPA